MRGIFTLLIASLAILLGSGTAWGQQGKGALLPEYQGQIAPRRGDAGSPNSVGYIGASGNVNNEFGAGETATISNGSVSWPSSNGMHTTPSAIQLGSDYSQNIVINTYNAGGYASEWLNITFPGLAASNISSWDPSTKGLAASHRNLLGTSISNPWPAGSSATLVATSTKQYTVDISERQPTFGEVEGILTGKAIPVDDPKDSYVDKVVRLYLVNHLGTNIHHWDVNATTTKLPYTVLLNAPDSTDNGVKLIQVHGDELVSMSADPLLAPGTPASTKAIQNYIRPTTVAIEGNNTFQNILFKDLGWWYNTHNIPEYTLGSYYGTVSYGVIGDLKGGCGHMSTAPTVTLTAIRSWVRQDYQGNNYLDAAVQLVNGARVCVNTDVLDQTNNIQKGAKTDDPTFQETNALIVWPVADRATLRTAGNFQVNMAHEAASATNDNVKYVAADFPDPDPDIYLYAGTLTESFGQTMKSFTNPQYTTVTTKAPYISTSSSLFGVNGDYLHTGLMADIHTDSTTFANSNKGVIEVGTTTSGKSHFHIYGNGMLKNYEGCTTLADFPVYFGDTKGGTPQLQINSNDTLYIVNFGNDGSNYCNADLLFHTTSVDSVNYAFTGSGAGALQIQALSDLRLRGNGTWDAITNGNNIYLLSDGGNISTQKLDISSDNAGSVGHGLVTFWAETDARTDGCVTNDGSTRFSESGNIYFNDSARLTRTTSLTTQTNIIAANNIRTAALTSTNTNDEDTTNIISRMGDIYLGYSAGTPIYSPSDVYPTPNGLTGNGNVFSYKGTGASGRLNILAGYDDQANTSQFGGGNIYFTRIHADMTQGNTHKTNITIPFSNEYRCGSTWVTGMLHERERANGSMGLYEHAGIIGGVGRCGEDVDFSSYGGKLEEPGAAAALLVTDTSLIYRANLGNLLVDAGLRGNIIMNQGTYLDFQNDAADAFFLTRSGDIDMRGQTNIDNLQGSILFLASSKEANKLKTGICGCTEQQNNVYLQDLQQRLLNTTKGSIFIGADNNVKLQYGGLKNVGTQIDPFLSENKGYNGVSCGTSYHCDADTTENKARDLILNFATQSGNGGMGIVASDLIDIYKNTIYTGGNGPGMMAVPTFGTLHGESVAGYGLYIKSQGNKDNWTKTDFNVLGKCGRDCGLEDCKDAFLHQTARVTFHADARIYAENQRVYIGSPVLDIYGYTELNTTQNKGSKTSITIQTDSLIMHDSLIIDGKLTKFNTWSNLYRDMPVFKFGHQRFTPPYSEDPGVCPECYTHAKTSGTKAHKTALDSIFVTFRNGASIPRLNTLVADHTVLSFLTDSFDHVKGDPVINAKFYTDTFKVRNHVELFKTANHTHDGHFELISEAQMDSKDYAGIYARHLHMEPIQPACSGKLYSQLWMQDPALDVITTSTFGGFGTIHADVHVEIEAKLAPGYASLGKASRCYEQKAGTLSMQDLRLDKGAEIHYSIGNVAGFDGELTDCIDVEELTLYGSVNVFVEKRACQTYSEGCYPIIRYNTVAVSESNLNNLKLGTTKIDGTTLSLNTSTPGVVYLCVGESVTPPILREIHISETPGVTMISPIEYGNHYIGSSGHFYFTVKFDQEPPLKVTTNRIINGVAEELTGTKNANGEYVYVIRQVKENIILTFGPEYATDNIDIVDGKAVWSYGNTIYIRVEKDDIASIYSITGQLVKRLEISEGSSSIQMERGVYIITLKDGSVHKVILK